MSHTGRATIAVLAVAAATFLGGCKSSTTDAEAAKAEELQAAIAPLGTKIETDVAASLYGTDGGAVCAEADDPGAVATEAASTVSHRFTLKKTEADVDSIAYIRAVIKTYCPDQLADYDDYIRDLATGKGRS
jgi:hypothetical protein